MPAPNIHRRTSSHAASGPLRPTSGDTFNGSIFVGAGLPPELRIPIPGTNGLAIEFRPRPGAWVPKGGSTSTLFFQNIKGNRFLRLDYGENPNTKTIDFHWNQKGVFSDFKIEGHTPAGTAGEMLYKGAKYFRYGGRVLLIAGAAIDLYSIVVANKPIRQATKVIAGWAGAWAGCELTGAGGAALGTVLEPGGGTAVLGVGGCVVGGIAGYWGLSTAAGKVYDWAAGTVFTRLPEIDVPVESPFLAPVP